MKRSGLGLIELLLAGAISTVVILGAVTVLLKSQRLELDSQESFWLSARQQEIRSYLRSPAGWTQLLADNPALNCVMAACPGLVGLQNLNVRIGSTLLDGSNAATGMDRRGDFCTGFSAASGHRDCVYGLSLKWEALCDNANCDHPQPRMTVQFSHKEPSGPLKPLPSYDIVVYKDAKLDSMAEVCASMGGNPVITGADPPTLRCDVPSLQVTCNPSAAPPDGPFVLGFGPTGQVSCGVPNLGTCASPGTATGFNADGSLICSATSCPLNSDCQGGWGACSVACGGGTQTYSVYAAAQGSGAGCPIANGATQACSTQVCAALTWGAPVTIKGCGKWSVAIPNGDISGLPCATAGSKGLFQDYDVTCAAPTLNLRLYEVICQ